MSEHNNIYNDEKNKKMEQLIKEEMDKNIDAIQDQDIKKLVKMPYEDIDKTDNLDSWVLRHLPLKKEQLNKLLTKLNIVI